MNWSEKYKPKKLDDIVDQGLAKKEVLAWLGGFRPGQALFLYGSSGNGKTLLVETLARERNWNLLFLSAAEKRGAKQLETFLSSLTTKPLFKSGQLILLDELGGLSGRDRGAKLVILKIIKTSKWPVFLIATNPFKPKLKELRTCSKLVKFGKVPVPSIAKRLAEICKQEKIDVSPDILKNLARWSQGDLRSAIQDLQTVGEGKSKIKEQDLTVLGYRERKKEIFNILPTIFRSGSIATARKAINEANIDSDELFWWAEANLQTKISREKLPEAYELLSRANLFRARVQKQQNWRFKGFMCDLLAGISLFEARAEQGYVPYRLPERIIQLGKSKWTRALMARLCQKIGKLTHSSAKIVKSSYLPYLRIILKNQKDIEGLELEQDEIKWLIS